ncbi:Hypothetical_protein [Hexamita inflata]|uniref:Hypothetical_protein n=1 Tax=Hexamita inflata TaxID=28002 RepID=A0AA86U9F8_9EUKA|nr:Hypothetical protein HINF_LOCUS21903 [Hexamita inflata]
MKSQYASWTQNVPLTNTLMVLQYYTQLVTDGISPIQQCSQHIKLIYSALKIFQSVGYLLSTYSGLHALENQSPTINIFQIDFSQNDIFPLNTNAIEKIAITVQNIKPIISVTFLLYSFSALIQDYGIIVLAQSIDGVNWFINNHVLSLFCHPHLIQKMSETDEFMTPELRLHLKMVKDLQNDVNELKQRQSDFAEGAKIVQQQVAASRQIADRVIIKK